MPSAFDAEFATSVPDFQGTFGEPILYETAPINAIVLRDTRESVDIEGGGNLFNSMLIRVSAVDVPAPVEIKKGGLSCDRFTIDGVVWILQRVMRRNVGGMHLLKLYDGGGA